MAGHDVAAGCEWPALPGDIQWPMQTREWWAALPSTPGAADWTESDWEQLKTAALMHAQIWGKGDFDLIPQLQKLLEPFGITPGARKSNLGAQTPTGDDRRVEDTPLARIAAKHGLKVVNGGKR